MSDAVYGSLSFPEAIEFFRKKLNIPTKQWNDLWKAMHTRGFMVAGAMKADLLTDLRAIVEAAIAEGITIQDFRKRFDSIVEKHGWEYTGGRNWRTAIIYDTNVRTAYSAGRWKQQTDSAMVRRRPYLQYRHGDSKNPRLEHLGWDFVTLPADDPWWKTHYTPNGWGCKCRVFSVSERDLERMGKTVDTAPDDGFYEWRDNKGKIHKIPNGIDPGWDYNPGTKDWKPDSDKYHPTIRKYLEKEI